MSVDPQAGRAGHAEGEGRGRGVVVLYVEDDRANVEVLRAVLGLRPGVELRAAPTIAAAVADAAAAPADLVLMDLNLPDGSGFDAIDAVREAAGRPALPTVIVTADATTATAQRADDLGVTLLTKPFNIDEILALVDEAAAASAS